MTENKNSGFSMPAEFSPHHGTILVFPERPGSWGTDPSAAQAAFAAIAARLSQCEQVYMLVSDRTAEAARRLLPPSVRLLHINTDDAWARDIAPTFVRNAAGALRGISWQFNAWGGDFDGLYPDYEQDDAAADAVCAALGIPCCDARPFVLEGGAIHCDGEGTVLVTEACLLSGGRNPQMTKAQITETLCNYLGAEKVIWIPFGIYNDETNEHIDNICAFTAPGEVVLAWCENPDDPQYAMSKADFDVLSQQTDAKGRRLRITKLPVPHVPVCVTEAECEGYEFAPGEDTREPGERLAASYVNFYFGNDCVLVPQFGGIYAEDDAKACEILRGCIPGREIVPVPARAILLGGGNIHCITQQIPQYRKDVSPMD
ncbi:MAG: agmatine deiminase [Oscillospiraceae bacterium]|nr:agmatine deiminase [Oscillospiraceae bacterium]